MVEFGLIVGGHRRLSRRDLSELVELALNIVEEGSALTCSRSQRLVWSRNCSPLTSKPAMNRIKAAPNSIRSSANFRAGANSVASGVLAIALKAEVAQWLPSCRARILLASRYKAC